MCMCIVFAFQFLRAKEVRIDIEVKRSEKKWREVTWSDDLWRFACGDVYVLWSCNLSPHHSDEKSLKPILECVLEKYVSLQCQGHVLSCSDSVKDPNDQMIQIWSYLHSHISSVSISTPSVFPSCCRQSEASIFEILSF